MKSLRVTLVIHLSFVKKNKVIKNMIIMKVDRKIIIQSFFWLYIKLSEVTFVTNDISFKKIKFVKKLLKR